MHSSATTDLGLDWLVLRLVVVDEVVRIPPVTISTWLGIH
jgi:hypothetical protein